MLPLWQMRPVKLPVNVSGISCNIIWYIVIILFLQLHLSTVNVHITRRAQIYLSPVKSDFENLLSLLANPYNVSIVSFRWIQPTSPFFLLKKKSHVSEKTWTSLNGFLTPDGWKDYVWRTKSYRIESFTVNLPVGPLTWKFEGGWPGSVLLGTSHETGAPLGVVPLGMGPKSLARDGRGDSNRWTPRPRPVTGPPILNVCEEEPSSFFFLELKILKSSKIHLSWKFVLYA